MRDPPSSSGNDALDGRRSITTSEMVRVTEISQSPIRILHRIYPGGYRQPMHCHERRNVSLVLSGEVVERTKADEHVAGPGSVVFKPAGTMHADRFGPSGAQVLLLDLGKYDKTSPGMPTGDSTAMMDGWHWFDGGPAARALFRIWYTYRQSPTDLVRLVEEILFALPGLLERESPRRSTAGAPKWLLSVRERVSSEYRDPPLVRELAADAGVHPTHLTRCFKAYVGTSVTGFLRRCRVVEAAHLMAAENCSLARVALEAGFADQSHMCRVFKGVTGLTPGQYRALL